VKLSTSPFAGSYTSNPEDRHRWGCLEDIEHRRKDEAYLELLRADRIPDPTTAGDFCRRFRSSDIDGLQAAIADTRRTVWTVESMFQEMTEHLTCEIKTLCYPLAAVFAFCLALMAWNGMSVIHAALRSVHGEETVEENLSGYYLSLEIAQVYHGMMIAIPAEEWAVFQNLTTAQLASLLKQLAKGVSLESFQKQVRGPKKPQPPRHCSGNGKHVATAKLLARRNH